MEKKRVLFIMNFLVCGGVERAMLSALRLIDPNKFEVDVCFVRKQGSLLGELPKWVRSFELPLLPLDRYELDHGRTACVKYCLLRFHWVNAMRILLLRIRWILSGRKVPYDIVAGRAMLGHLRGRVDYQYDYSFSYGGMIFVSLLDRVLVSAAKHYVWMHNESQPDYEGPGYFEHVYSKFDGIFACSTKLAGLLNDRWDPSVRRIRPMSYYLSPTLYRQMAEVGRGFEDQFEGLRILTVGRLDRQKGIDIAAEVCARLKKEGLRFRWYIIGEGEVRPVIERLIAEMGIADSFVLLGLQTNPYPYFKQCDLYVQPSRYEAYCITVAEARAFNKPIVCTNFVGADEQIKNGRTGIISEKIDADSICRDVRRLLTDEALRRDFSAALALENGDTEKAAREAWEKILN